MSRPRTLRALDRAGVEALVDWAAAEGWNPGLHDAAAFHAADPQGFIGAFVGSTMVAGIAAIAYGEDFGFIGLYICRPDARGQGHGRAVWDAGMARLAGRTIGLDAVDEQRDAYRRMGFVEAYRTVRLGWSSAPAGLLAGQAAATIGPLHAAELAAYDRRCFPAPRQAFLSQWVRPPHQVLAMREGGTVTGYGVLRQCRAGFKIGPLFADGDRQAMALLAALGAAAAGPLQLDVPKTEGDFSARLMNAGLVAGFATTRMYRGPVPSRPTARIFAVTSLELG